MAGSTSSFPYKTEIHKEKLKMEHRFDSFYKPALIFIYLIF